MYMYMFTYISIYIYIYCVYLCVRRLIDWFIDDRRRGGSSGRNRRRWKRECQTCVISGCVRACRCLQPWFIHLHAHRHTIFDEERTRSSSPRDWPVHHASRSQRGIAFDVARVPSAERGQQQENHFPHLQHLFISRSILDKRCMIRGWPRVQSFFTSNPHQIIMYFPVQVNRFYESVLLIVQYRYL